MATRLVELLLADGRADDLVRELKALGLEPLTRETLAGDRLRVRLLVDADESGHVVDAFQKAFGAYPDFGLVLLPVEAVLPRREDVPAAGAARTPGAPGISREELHADVNDMCRLSGVFVATVVLSAVVAAVGLLRDNVAVVIGAMVIAPLLGPNVALALGTTLGDTALIRRALVVNLSGFALSLAFAIVLGMILSIDPGVRSIDDRTVVHLSDIVLALASGAAGTLALTTGIPIALVGVMVAVALLPPTVVLGLTIGDGHWGDALGAGLLLLANVICINLAGVLTFLVKGVRPLSWWEAARARRATRRAIALWIVLLAMLVAVIVVARDRTEDAATPATAPTGP